MSLRLQFRSPARQRGAIGLMAVLALGMALVFLLVMIDSGRLYLEKRSLQRVADMAALEAATRNGDCAVGGPPLPPMPPLAQTATTSPFLIPRAVWR